MLYILCQKQPIRFINHQQMDINKDRIGMKHIPTDFKCLQKLTDFYVVLGMKIIIGYQIMVPKI